MTVSSSTSKNTYPGTGAQTTFAYTFGILAEDQVKVQIKNASDVYSTKILTTDYTVTGTGNASTRTNYVSGNIVFEAGSIPLSTDTVVITRSVPLSQNTDYVENSTLPAESLEEALDKLTMIAQEQDEEITRSIKIPADSSVDTTLPQASANKALVWNAAATAITNSEFDINATVSVTETKAVATTQLILAGDYSSESAVNSQGYSSVLDSGHTKYAATGTTTLGKAGTTEFELGFIYDSVGTQFKINETVIDARMLGIVGDWDGASGTDNTAAMLILIDYSELTGLDFYFYGRFLVSGNIEGIHSVKKFGTGSIAVGTDEFYVEPTGSLANSIYVSNAGVATNDGLSTSTPVTIQAGFDFLKLYGPNLEGIWTVALAAGTYTNATDGFDNTLSGVKSINRVNILGAATAGHPAVPTTIYDGTGGSNYEHGIRCSGIGLKVEVNDIKFINFTSSNTRIGLVGESEVDFLTNNIHADNCDWCGVYAASTARARVYGGILNACRAGFIANATACTFSGEDGNPIIVSNSTESGVYWSRGSQGHVDYVKYEDNAVALLVAENSRVDTVKNEFDRNTIAIRTQTGGVFGEGGAVNIFGTGADINTTELDYKAFSGDTSELRFSTNITRVDYDRTTYAHSGSTDTVISTPYAIPAYRLQGAGKGMKVEVYGSFIQATGGSILKILFGGMTLAITVSGAQSNTAFILRGELLEVSGGYRAFGILENGLTGQRLASASSGFDSTISQNISIGAHLSNAGDSLAMYRTDISITG
jgi:hypothetical protein